MPSCSLLDSADDHAETSIRLRTRRLHTRRSDGIGTDGGQSAVKVDSHPATTRTFAVAGVDVATRVLAGISFENGDIHERSLNASCDDPRALQGGFECSICAAPVPEYGRF